MYYKAGSDFIPKAEKTGILVTATISLDVFALFSDKIRTTEFSSVRRRRISFMPTVLWVKYYKKIREKSINFFIIDNNWLPVNRDSLHF